MPAEKRRANPKRTGMGDDCERDCGDEQAIFFEVIETRGRERGAYGMGVVACERVGQ